MKVHYFLVILFANLTDFTIFSLKTERISCCRYQNQKITFICAENLGSLFSKNGVQCDKKYFQYNSVEGIDFENCLFSVINETFFEKFTSLKTLVISDMEMETLDRNIFRGTKKLEKLFASRNRLTEIPPLLFNTTENFRYADFSNNLLQKVDNFGFEGENSLRTLNLSYNNIVELDLRDLAAPSLDILDVSHNNITILTTNTFDKFTKLERLNLAFNPIGNLKIETFSYLKKLEFLNLRKTNISSLQIGTFSYTRLLYSLDLSENALKELDCHMFLPSLKNLKSLYISDNQLTDLIDFRNTLFPRLQLLDIKNNNFNCTYLKSFMKSVDWEHIGIPVDLNLVDPSETNIHGIKCINTDPNGLADVETVEVTTQYYSEKTIATSESSENSSTTYFNVIIILLVLLISLILLPLFMFLFVNRDKIFKRINIEKSKQNVEYSNDMCLLVSS